MTRRSPHKRKLHRRKWIEWEYNRDVLHRRSCDGRGYITRMEAR